MTDSYETWPQKHRLEFGERCGAHLIPEPGLEWMQDKPSSVSGCFFEWKFHGGTLRALFSSCLHIHWKLFTSRTHCVCIYSPILGYCQLLLIQLIFHVSLHVTLPEIKGHFLKFCFQRKAAKIIQQISLINLF